jgi:hypothetical protein
MTEKLFRYASLVGALANMGYVLYLERGFEIIFNSCLEPGKELFAACNLESPHIPQKYFKSGVEIQTSSVPQILVSNDCGSLQSVNFSVSPSLDEWIRRVPTIYSNDHGFFNLGEADLKYIRELEKPFVDKRCNSIADSYVLCSKKVLA